MKKLIIASGYFNPLHSGHVEYFKKARRLGDELCVIVNNDAQRELKGSRYFMDEEERLCIVSALRDVDAAIISIDTDRTVRKTLAYIYEKKSEEYKLYFVNGGDQNNEIIPETETCLKLGISMIDGLGRKIQSSSWLLEGREKENE